MEKPIAISPFSPEFLAAENRGRFNFRALVLQNSVPSVADLTAEHIDSTASELHEKFRRACDFMEYSLEDAFSASVDALQKCGFFPYSELAYEFNAFQSLLLEGYYKNTRDSMRRMLEVALSAVVMLSECKNVSEANKWVSSESEAPRFSSLVKTLESNELVDELNNRFEFSKQMKELYWNFCDYCHTRGINYSTRVKHESEACISGVFISKFSQEECELVMEQFCSTIGYLAVLLIVHNPALLLPVDKESKWGLNGPISGFFSEGQVRYLFTVLPDGYADFLKEYSKINEGIVGLKEYFEQLPNLSDDDIKNQVQDFHRMFGGE